jgi:hypothetical protein
MNQAFTIAQIRARFDAEWVLIENPQTDENLALQDGVVRSHSKDREEVYRQAIAMPEPKRFAMLYTGQLAPGTAILLDAA